MPLYEYQCQDCGHRFEVIQKFSDDPLEKCPKCGQAVERLVSSPAIQFKGTGWYVTDYARRNAPADGKSESKDGAETPATPKLEKPESKADTAPATSTPPAE